MAFAPVCLAFMPIGRKLRTGKDRRSFHSHDSEQKAVTGPYHRPNLALCQDFQQENGGFLCSSETGDVMSQFGIRAKLCAGKIGIGSSIQAQGSDEVMRRKWRCYGNPDNYLSDLRHFATWCESIWRQGQEETISFIPLRVTTPTITDYRTYLQLELHLKPNSINRSLISLKRYFAWLVSSEKITHDPAKVVKLIGEEVSAPRHLDDQEEHALVAAVTEMGNPRDRVVIVLMLHTGLRARELCTLTRAQVSIGKRSGTLKVYGKRNKYREIPLNATARGVLDAYDPSLSKSHTPDATPLFLSEKRHAQLTERGLGYLVKKYAEQAKLHDMSPHDLRHRFGYRMVASVPLHRLAHLMGHDSLDTTMIYVKGTKADLQQDVEKIAWR